MYSSPAKICLISESITPTPEDLTILAGEGIEYADIKWSVDRLEFGSWVGAARSYKYVIFIFIFLFYVNYTFFRVTLLKMVTENKIFDVTFDWKMLMENCSYRFERL